MAERGEEEKEKPYPAGPSLVMTMPGIQFLAPDYISKSLREECHYTLSQLVPLGNFDRADEFYVNGDAMGIAWIHRIFCDKLEDKVKYMQVATAAVGQSSRARGGATQQSLTRETMEIIDREPQKKGRLARFFGV